MTDIKLDALVDLTELTYTGGTIINPFNNSNNKIIFADDTASGRPCKLVDQYIIEEIYPYYSNTHSNATCGIMMKNLVKKTRDIIRQTMNLSSNHKIFFSGNGCTGAFNHLVNKIDFTKYDKIYIHNTPFEHHSNFLPWKEMINDLKKTGKNKNRIIEQHLIDADNKCKSTNVNDLLHFDIEPYISNLEKDISTEKSPITRLDIFSLTACSNVTGKRFDILYKNLWEFINTKRKIGHNMYLILDYACSAPYVDIDMSQCDGACFSGHKFFGGQCTPGVLIINENILEIGHPYEPGGGCVEKADDKCTVYKSDPEMREMGGTPNIIGIIRLGYVLMIKKALIDIINHNKSIISEYVTKHMILLTNKYPNCKILGLDDRLKSDLPIFSVIIDSLQYNLVTVLLNDLFGIQTRGGNSCCGTLGRICKDQLNINGWCRITFSYLHTKHDIDYILKSLEYVIQNGYQYIDKYDYDSQKNLYFKK
jgi:selenocysteine lyase/cysteine desulfurase